MAPSRSKLTLDADLSRACAKGNLGRVRKLLAEGADPKRGHPSFSPPLVAAGYGASTEVVEILVAAGASMDEYGAPGLVAAACHDDDDDGGKAVYELFLARGAIAMRSGKHGVGYSPHHTPIGLVVNNVEAALAGTSTAKAALEELVVIERSLHRLLAAGADRRAPSKYAGTLVTPAQRLEGIYSSWGDKILESKPIKAICERIAKLVV